MKEKYRKGSKTIFFESKVEKKKFCQIKEKLDQN